MSWRHGDCAGDSLLFAAGAFAALGTLNVWALLGIFITAAILGDALNYAIGNYAGKPMLPAVVQMTVVLLAICKCWTASSLITAQEECSVHHALIPGEPSQIHNTPFHTAIFSLSRYHGSSL